ncbi:MAG TPA: aspartate kinase [Myxococcaceae bacterium]|nr:aspartate kinase [Myxococcaceae bacterium]
MKPVWFDTPSEGRTSLDRRRPLVVKKFGGTSVANVERIRHVARLALEDHQAGKDVVVVVSAMSGETDRLLKLAHEVMPIPDGRELDVMASTGEQVSVALTSMAIKSLGGKACSMLGYQLPMLTDSAFTRARIQWVEPRPIRKLLAQGCIVVVAGFQGVDPQSNITTLGRGGSDTSAVALAAALGAEVCEIYTDVDGVYTADPRICPTSRKLGAVSYEEMLELASHGAKVLQVRSVEVAMKYEVPVHVRSTFSDEEGTWVVPKERIFEARVLTGLACEKGHARLELLGVEERQELVVELMGLLAELNMSVDMLCHSGRPEERTRADIALTLPEADLVRAREYLEQLLGGLRSSELRVSTGLAKVSMVGIGIRSDPSIPARLCRSLAQHGISVSGLMVNELRISFLVEEALAEQAIRVLHEVFELGGQPLLAEPVPSAQS